MTKRIVFEVPDDAADEMRRNSVYLDVYGRVRWTHDFSVVAGASQWETHPPQK